MTANEMRAKFLLTYEGARLAARTFNDREIQDFINKAQLELIKQRYAAFRNNKQVGYGGNPMVPQSQSVRSSELAGLVSGTAAIPLTAMIKGTQNNGALRGVDFDAQLAFNYGWFVPLPNEAMYVIYESANTQKAVGQAYAKKFNVPVLEITHDYYSRGIYDNYAQPYENLIWSLDWGTYTVATFDSGSFNNSTKTNTTTGTGTNMTGYNGYTNSTPIDYVLTDGNYIPAVGDATVKPINTNRSKYLIPGKDWLVTEYICHYIKLPADVKIDIITPGNQVNCQLADFLHQEIVDYAVKLASAAITPEQNKYNVNQLESKEDE